MWIQAVWWLYRCGLYSFGSNTRLSWPIQLQHMRAYAGMAYIVLAYALIAYVGMTYIVTACIFMACVVIAYVAMADIVMACTVLGPT